MVKLIFTNSKNYAFALDGTQKIFEFFYNDTQILREIPTTLGVFLGKKYNIVNILDMKFQFAYAENFDSGDVQIVYAQI